MRKRWVVFFVALFALAGAASLGAAETPTVALSDFVVNSGNPSYSFLGKGFAEIVAFELKKSPDLRLVDREKRNELLGEMEFALTGLTDPAAQLEIGKLLSVRYLVGGSITDMGGPLLVSLSMVDVETSEVVWRDQVTESGGRYAYIGAYFGKSLLKHFKASVAKSTEAALAAAAEKDAASVVALSKGIAALDKGDKTEAKKQLAEAKRIDPTNAVAGAFLAKLASASAKFKVVPERYVSYYNPAYLGGMEKDRVYFNWSTANLAWGDANPGLGESRNYWIVMNEAGDYGTFDRQRGQAQGYQLPIGRRFGVGFEIFSPEVENDIQRQFAPPLWKESGHETYRYSGGFLSCGYKLSPNLSLGLGGLLQKTTRSYYSEFLPVVPPPGQPVDQNGYWLEDFWSYGAILAAALKNGNGDVAWDIIGSWSNDKLYYFDTDPLVQAYLQYGAPLYVEQTLSWSPNGQKTFLALKQVNDIYLDRDLYYGRLMPCVEQWFFDLFSLRLGAEGSIVARGGVTELGWGATAGATVKVWKFELDANYTLRLRPSRSLPGVTVPEYVFFLTFSANDLVTSFTKR
ncbi:MAG: hypothetical protein JNG85_05900 [Spirochaetaceae bacterium]|nr:hypothetical protein [Spirochaetaceae bacterium]